MTLQSLNNQHRAAIIAKDVQLADQIAAKYHPIWHKLLAKLQKLLHDMQEAEKLADAQGVPFYAQVWLIQFQRLDTLLASVHDDIATFARQAEQLVQTQLRTAWNAGEDNALALLKEQLPHVGIQFGVPNPDAIEVLLQRAVNEQGVTRLFRGMDTQMAELVHKRIMASVALGEGPRKLAYDIRLAFGKDAKGKWNYPLHRALTIARTESIRAYRDASLLTYRANSDVVTGWTWSAASGACPFCSSMDGTHHTLDEEMSSHPNCRCVMLPDAKSYDEILAAFAA